MTNLIATTPQCWEVAKVIVDLVSQMIISQLLVNKFEWNKFDLGLYFIFFLEMKIPLYWFFSDTVCIYPVFVCLSCHFAFEKDSAQAPKPI